MFKQIETSSQNVTETDILFKDFLLQHFVNCEVKK